MRVWIWNVRQLSSWFGINRWNLQTSGAAMAVCWSPSHRSFRTRWCLVIAEVPYSSSLCSTVCNLPKKRQKWKKNSNDLLFVFLGMEIRVKVSDYVKDRIEVRFCSRCRLLLTLILDRTPLFILIHTYSISCAGSTKTKSRSIRKRGLCENERHETPTKLFLQRTVKGNVLSLSWSSFQENQA